MVKRLVIKTVLICIGIFLVLTSLVTFYVLKKYPLDLEEHVSVVTAAIDIEEGTVIEEKHVRSKEIQQSASNTLLITDISKVIGKRASIKILKSDYIRSDVLSKKGSWFRDDERIIVLPVNMEERLANLIKKGSYIDIRLMIEGNGNVETILTKIKVQEILDETGTPISEVTGINSRIAYMELILNEISRQKIYSSLKKGRFVYELYCDEEQGMKKH